MFKGFRNYVSKVWDLGHLNGQQQQIGPVPELHG